MVSFVEFFKLNVLFIVAIFDLVHDVEVIFPLPYVQTSSGNLI